MHLSLVPAPPASARPVEVDDVVEMLRELAAVMTRAR
jgi:hypothetical protein